MSKDDVRMVDVGSDKVEREQLELRERELKKYRGVISQREREFSEYSSKVKEEQLRQERQLRREFEEREKMFADREKRMLEKQRISEERFAERAREVDSLRQRLREDISVREARIQDSLVELEVEKERYKEEARKRVEANSRNYVSDALESLDVKERQFHRISKIWGGVGAAALALGLAFFVVVGIYSAKVVDVNMTWPLMAFVVFKGLVVIALVAGIAKYSFLFSGYYMQESLKNADRRHAINFGKFYLESYGAAAEWSQVKEAFEHWNISESNAFSKSEAALPDISVLERSASIIERIAKSVSGRAGVGG